MIEVLFSTAVSAALIASAAIPMIASRSRRSRHEFREIQRKRDGTNHVDMETVGEMIRRGYAYSVDLGDSMVFVVVVEKKTTRSFLSVEEEPLAFVGISSVQNVVPAEATG